MKQLSHLWVKFATPRNQQVVYILLVLSALAVAAGAPGAGSGVGFGGLSLPTFLP